MRPHSSRVRTHRSYFSGAKIVFSKKRSELPQNSGVNYLKIPELFCYLLEMSYICSLKRSEYEISTTNS